VLNAVQLCHAGWIIKNGCRIVRLGREGIPLCNRGCALEGIADTFGSDN
jgi:hypothetical protein